MELRKKQNQNKHKQANKQAYIYLCCCSKGNLLKNWSCIDMFSHSVKEEKQCLMTDACLQLSPCYKSLWCSGVFVLEHCSYTSKNPSRCGIWSPRVCFHLCKLILYYTVQPIVWHGSTPKVDGSSHTGWTANFRRNILTTYFASYPSHSPVILVWVVCWGIFRVFGSTASLKCQFFAKCQSKAYHSRNSILNFH